jgi:hypothetical protein
VPRRKNEPAAKDRRLIQGEESRGLSSAGEPLLVARSLDDFVSVAETGLGSNHSLLVPETLDAIFELLDLSGGFRIVPLRELVPELRAALGGALELGLDFGKCLHVL